MKLYRLRFAEAERRDPEHLRRWRVVVDGDEKQLRHIKRTARKFLVSQANVCFYFC